MVKKFDVAIIGAGPGGYVAAIRLAQLKKKTAIIEKRKTLGGTCLNVGCIPSKTLLDSSEHYLHAKTKLKDHGIEVQSIKLNLKKLLDRKDRIVSEITKGVDFLMKKNKINHFEGMASFKSKNSLEVKNGKKTHEIQADQIIIASGSLPIELPEIPIDGRQIITSDHAINLPKVPKHLIIIGAGVIGLELGSVWKRLGAKVTIVESMPSLMWNADRQTARLTQRLLEEQGIQFLMNHRVVKAEKKNGLVEVTTESTGKKQMKLNGDILLVAIGRRPATEHLSLEKVGISLTKHGRIKVDNRFKTNISNIYAIGDVIEGPMLAHKASEEGIAVAEIIANNYGHVNYNAIPWIIYTWPEIAWIGLGEEELQEKNIEYKVGISIFKSNARAKAMNEIEGHVKVLSDKRTDKILGLYIIGPRASDMIAEAVIAIEFGASAEDIARSVHAHPTLSEVVKEASMDVDKWAIHS